MRWARAKKDPVRSTLFPNKQSPIDAKERPRIAGPFLFAGVVSPLFQTKRATSRGRLPLRQWQGCDSSL